MFCFLSVNSFNDHWFDLFCHLCLCGFGDIIEFRLGIIGKILQ